MKNLNDGLTWAFTPEALDRLRELTVLGLDLDLAVAVLEIFWPEEQIYDLGDRQALCTVGSDG